MKRLIADLYKLIYRLTHTHAASVVIAVAYVSLLNLITLYGIGLLMERNAMAKMMKVLFSARFIPFTSVVMFLLNLWLMTPLKNLHKERKKPPFYPPVIAYTLACVVLLIFIHYRNELPN